MIDRAPITRLKVIIGSMSALTAPERYWLYKLVENLVLYDRVIDRAVSLTVIEDKLSLLVDEWYEIQRTIRDKFDPATVSSLNARCIPAYRMYLIATKGADFDEQSEPEIKSDEQTPTAY